MMDPSPLMCGSISSSLATARLAFGAVMVQRQGAWALPGQASYGRCASRSAGPDQLTRRDWGCRPNAHGKQNESAQRTASEMQVGKRSKAWSKVCKTATPNCGTAICAVRKVGVPNLGCGWRICGGWHTFSPNQRAPRGVVHSDCQSATPCLCRCLRVVGCHHPSPAWQARDSRAVSSAIPHCRCSRIRSGPCCRFRS